MAHIELRALRKAYGALEVVRGIDLEIADREFLVLVGPSGCGKTTTLRMLAGLETVTSGDIIIDGKRVNDLQARSRDIAMVFQSYALFPHMTVRQNISFGMRLRRTPKDEIERRVQEAAEILGLGELLDRRPRQLSGGQRQRVAMGRAIVRNPRVFLFDEPLSNLDAKLRVQMRAEIRKLHRRIQTTAVYVTHDQVEAMTLADRIVVMNGGIIEQVGTPQELYDHPRSRFVAGFIGSPSMNFVACKLVANETEMQLLLPNLPPLTIPGARRNRYEPFADQDMILGIRPEHLTERRNHVNPHQVDLEVTVDSREPMGNDTMVYCELGDATACARVSPSAASPPGERMWLTVDLEQMHLIDPKSDKVIDTLR